jgi:uncharacterized membrane protein (DUF485 family)
MKIPKEIHNGFIIFLGIGLYFLVITLIGLQNKPFFRLVNFVFLFYGVDLTVNTNFAEGNKNIFSNAISAFITCFIGTFLSVFALLIYIHLHGGESYIPTLAKTFIFGGNPSVASYCLSLSLEGAASSIIVTLIYMLYTNNKYNID